MMMAPTLSHLDLTDRDIQQIHATLVGLNMLSVSFNKITYDGLDTLLTMAPNLVTLDLEANEIASEINRQAVRKLWSADGSLRHLNVSHNSLTKQSLTCLFQDAGSSNLQTLDAAKLGDHVEKVPVCLIPYLLRNRSLERVDLRGLKFCTFPTEGEQAAKTELYLGCPIKRALAVHPML